MKKLLAPWTIANSAARHLAWFVSYQLTGEARTSGEARSRR